MLAGLNSSSEGLPRGSQIAYLDFPKYDSVRLARGYSVSLEKSKVYDKKGFMLSGDEGRFLCSSLFSPHPNLLTATWQGCLQKGGVVVARIVSVGWLLRIGRE